MPEYMFISGHSVFTETQNLKPILPRSAPLKYLLLLLKLNVNGLLLCQVNFTKLFYIFCKSLMSVPSRNTLKHFEAYSVFKKVFLFRLLHISAWMWAPWKLGRAMSIWKDLYKNASGATQSLLKDKGGNLLKGKRNSIRKSCTNILKNIKNRKQYMNMMRKVIYWKGREIGSEKDEQKFKTSHL